MQSRITLLSLMLLVLTGLGAQPTLVKDIYPGDDGSPNNFFNYNGMLLFRADTETEDVELWISDGTEAGTMLVKDLNPDPGVTAGNSNPDNLTLYNGLVYFTARNDTDGLELWVTDGTTEGTTQFFDIQSGSGNGAPFDYVIYNDKLYFTANDGVNSSELWVTDGTVEGTMMVVDINPGGGPGNPNFKTVIDGVMYFTANDGVNGSELWMSDGTAAGSMMIKDIRAGSANSLPSRYIGYNGEVFFRANDGVNGTELWKTDGTEEGTVLVKDINPGSSSSSPDNFIVFNGLLFFEADDGTNGDELWVTDGTEEGTFMLLDINPSGDGNPGDFLQILPTFVFFVAENDVVGEELWYMTVDEDGELDIDLFADLNPGPDDSNPQDMVWTGYALYFSAETADFGQELFRLSVDDDEPVRISDINPGAANSDIDDIFQLGNTLFFEATDGVTGDELWKLDVPLPAIGATDAEGQTVMNGDTIDLGDVIVGQSAVTTVSIDNAGDVSLVLVDNNLDAPGSDFAFTFDFFPLDILETGESGPLGVTFSPTTEGEQFYEAVIVSEAANATEFHIVFRGNGIPAVAQLVITDAAGGGLLPGSTVDFGDVIVGQESIVTINLQNDGNVSLELSSLTIDEAAFTAGALTGSLAPGESTTLDLTFAPATDGSVSGTLTIASNDNNHPSYELQLNGNGLAAIATIAVTDDQGVTVANGGTLNFGSVLVDTDSTITLTLANDGNVDLVLSDLTVTGDEFSAGALPGTIAPGATGTLEVTFAPVMVGGPTGSLAFNTNDADNATFSISLAGDVFSSLRELTATELGVFPNPVDSRLVLRLSEAIPDAELMIYSGSGQLLRRVDAGAVNNGFSLDVSDLPAGSYLLELRNSEVRGMTKFIKQ